jgi:hypothetical protein
MKDTSDFQTLSISCSLLAALCNWLQRVNLPASAWPRLMVVSDP